MGIRGPVRTNRDKLIWRRWLLEKSLGYHHHQRMGPVIELLAERLGTTVVTVKAVLQDFSPVGCYDG
jgi:hypothetical protein